MNRNGFYFFAQILIFGVACQSKKKVEESKNTDITEILLKRWTEKQADAWAIENGWLHGCSFFPGTSINQLEVWQAEAFEPETIDHELGWAEEIDVIKSLTGIK